MSCDLPSQPLQSTGRSQFTFLGIHALCCLSLSAVCLTLRVQPLYCVSLSSLSHSACPSSMLCPSRSRKNIKGSGLGHLMVSLKTNTKRCRRWNAVCESETLWSMCVSISDGTHVSSVIQSEYGSVDAESMAKIGPGHTDAVSRFSSLDSAILVGFAHKCPVDF